MDNKEEGGFLHVFECLARQYFKHMHTPSPGVPPSPPLPILHVHTTRILDARLLFVSIFLSVQALSPIYSLRLPFLSPYILSSNSIAAFQRQKSRCVESSLRIASIVSSYYASTMVTLTHTLSRCSIERTLVPLISNQIIISYQDPSPTPPKYCSTQNIHLPYHPPTPHCLQLM